MVKPTLEEIRASDLTPLERELALASFGAEALAEVPAAVTPAAAAVAAIDAALRDPAHGHPGAGHPAKGAAASRESVAASRESAVSSSPASPPPAPAPYDPALDSNPHMQAWRGRLDALRARNAIAKPMRACGRLTRAAGLVLEAVGLRLSVGAEVMIELPFGSSLAMAEAEVVGFSGDKLFLMPTTEVIGLLPGARVYPLESAPIADPMAGAKRLPVGWELLGRVLDASGRPLDGLGPLGAHADAPLSSPVINPLNREPIHKVLDVGVRAINALLTVGRGQRMGLFAGSGVGKSVLLGTMARYTSAEVIVIGLIGERGREVKEFIEQILGEEGLARSVVIAAPADVSPLLRMQAASYSTSLAEYFRDQGKHVLLLMDSLTRYAMAQREIALAVGEPPATKGYPPSVFAKLPALVERTGNGPAGGGSITAFYTVLTEGDDQQDPIADSARAILDGHIVLSRSLAEAGHYPAIDIEASISRAMTALIDDNHLEKTRMFKQMLSRYQRNRDLINVGAYSSGRDALLDRAIALYPRMEAFLQQGFRECANFEPSLELLDALFAQGG
ncbi:flagellar protein export ATPase FliI [Paraburkholderia nemoris]|uniref:Flagellum-specific ATP synthase n=1 Tax=Paraburkholderia nemoris TaxID=2793076 RepID=A0ABN7MGI4_9BURK|nr:MULTISPECIES: flagellar protein export ATPase FliI [Paraburkholderia]MBK5148338.1 flagellar protein export ATPase FliI [Burkholderia sp. R-69608]MBK3740593.1 flagellar protein export ATPase FliI [Paraburkholderia aspalathi]MBK3782812.1 flagellar protein export ATPase FliI [Paraburkholderia aspalathi]MBK3813935.1 flagellar protein export ATPase FliI [Paraburkholderia aspalathi]CAE6756685.1 Flagellum-specific ATP synthase [Paraburkholderia nemoris]